MTEGARRNPKLKVCRFRNAELQVPPPPPDSEPLAPPLWPETPPLHVRAALCPGASWKDRGRLRAADRSSGFLSGVAVSHTAAALGAWTAQPCPRPPGPAVRGRAEQGRRGPSRGGLERGLRSLRAGGRFRWAQVGLYCGGGVGRIVGWWGAGTAPGAWPG